MEEPFDRQTLLLSALWSGVGQLVRGQTNKGLLLLGVGTVTAILGGVTGLLLRVLTFGRLKVGPRRLNPLALVWLGTYLYNLYDAYNLAAGAEDDEDDLFEYEEYEPREAGATAGITDGAMASTMGAQGDSPTANTGPVGTDPPPREDMTDGPPAATAGPHSAAAVNRAFEFSTLGIPWAEGVTKAQLLDMLGDEAQIQGVFGHYLPSGTVFHSEEEVLTLIPVQAWQDAQGGEWTGGDLPGSDSPSGYLDSAAGRLPPGETSKDMMP